MALLAGFVLWERRTASPLVDLSLFASPSFTWGATLATAVNFTMFGVLFTVPQLFQAVNGTDALGTGLRLLPMIGGLVVGARIGGKLAEAVGAKIVVAAGFALLVAGFVIGSATTASTGYGVVATWLAVIGAGIGLAMPAAMDAAVGALETDGAGAGSSLITALRQVGGTIGVAVLGTVLSAGYRARLDVTGLPAPAADAVRDSVNSGVVVAHATGSDALLGTVRGAFTHGMSGLLWVCAGVAAAALACAVAFLPRSADTVEPVSVDQGESEDDLVVR